ncbi:tyrosine-type recombinase/integrase [Vibrio ishigakensis]|nr:tyrosine-type recombinase/integrase [Vibrio ishigakensis]
MFKNRNSNYYSRIYLPKKLAVSGCPAEVRFSLRTKSRSTAIDRSLLILQKARTLIARAMKESDLDAKTFISSLKEELNLIACNSFLSEGILPAHNQPVEKQQDRKVHTNPSREDLVTRFIDFKQAEGVKPKNLGLMRSRIQSLIQATDKPFEEITAREASGFLKKLYEKRLSAKTVRDYLAAIKQFYNWLILMEYARANPFGLVKAKSDGRLASEQRRKWRRQELGRLFSHDNFTGVIGSNDSHLNYQKKLEDYWIPHLLLFTGARVSEICQLSTKDVVKLGDIWCISINENDGKSIKSRASIRHVPLHNKLLSLGFLDYVNQRAETYQKKLFDIKPYGQNNCWSEQFGKRFAKVLTQQGFHGKDRPTLHGLRHTFIDTAQSEGIAENEIADIVGHTKQTMTYGRYGKRVSLVRLQLAVNRIEFKVFARND